MIHLHRFTWNRAKRKMVKLDNRVTFGPTLEMWPYMNGGMMANGDHMEFIPGQPLEQSDCQYKLTGVIVFLGDANCGHYYSLVKEVRYTSNDDVKNGSKWYKLDDHRVTQFLPDDARSGFDAQCFGGINTRNDDYSFGLTGDVKTNSAYMLFYSHCMSISEVPTLLRLNTSNDPITSTSRGLNDDKAEGRTGRNGFFLNGRQYPQ